MSQPFHTLRLRKHADYGFVYGVSRKSQSASLSYFYRQRESLPEVSAPEPAFSARFGITVPRALGGAVLRNRLKRRIRVAARAALHLLPPGTDVVLHPRPEAATVAFPKLQRELESVFHTVAQRLATGAINTPLPRRPRTKGPNVSGKAAPGKAAKARQR
jgi:ribonuclease P protein component